MLKKILIGLALVIGGFLAFAATRPSTYRVERGTRIAASAPVIYAQLEDFKAWANWSPWEKLDPQMARTYGGAPKGVEATYEWAGNKKVGKGKMTIVEAEPPRVMKTRLEFIEPFPSVATTSFQLAAEGDAGTSVTWAMDGTHDFVGKVFGIFMNMDQMIGADFERGLASLKAVAEAEAEAAAARAKAEAEAQAAAEKAAAEAEAAAMAAAEAEATTKKTRKGKK